MCGDYPPRYLLHCKKKTLQAAKSMSDRQSHSTTHALMKKERGSKNIGLNMGVCVYVGAVSARAFSAKLKVKKNLAKLGHSITFFSRV